jgi:hypothetical protein
MGLYLRDVAALAQKDETRRLTDAEKRMAEVLSSSPMAMEKRFFGY